MRMVYEVIGKTVLYIIGTLILGAFIGAIDDDNCYGVFWGAWIASIIVFLVLIIPTP